MDPEIHDAPRYAATLAWSIVAALGMCAAMFVCIVLSSVVAWPADAPPRPTCSYLRQIVERLGEAVVVSQARAQGMTDEQIAAARRACDIRERKH